ncbi:S-adenosyl-L-methionine-dependent methyltransferase [Aspergillus heterothallicus]
MAITEESNNDLQGIQKALQALNQTAEQCHATYIAAGGDDVESLSAKRAARNALVLEAFRFLQIAQGPIDAAATCYEKTAHLGSVRALLEMGLFEELPLDGSPATTQHLADKLGVDESLLARLMRNTALYGPFEETGPDTYRHTPFSLVYLSPEVRGMFRFAMDDHMPAHLKLHEFLRQNGWKEPRSISNNPYTYAHATNGNSMFQNLSTKPKRMEAFNNGMTLQAMTSIWMIDLFPFREVLGSLHTDSRTVLAVDIGGGKGKAISRIRSLAGEPSGRFILQDQNHVIASLDKASPYLQGIEPMAHDFFTEQPVQGALVYLIRRCLHNWPEESVINILGKTKRAMKVNHSRLLIEEIIVPVRDSGIEEGWMDLIMMSLGAKQRTLKEWRTVLEKAGLELTRVYHLPGDPHGLIEAQVRE